MKSLVISSALCLTLCQVLNYLKVEEAKLVLKYWYDSVSSTKNIDQVYIDKLTQEISDKFNIKGKKIFFPLRGALYGSFNGPDLFTIISILGVVEATNKSNKSGCLFNLFVFENTECIINMASKLLNLRVIETFCPLL